MISAAERGGIIGFQEIDNPRHRMDRIAAQFRAGTVSGSTACLELQPEISFMSCDNFQTGRFPYDGKIRFETRPNQSA